MYASDKVFFNNAALSLNLDLETWFKVTEQPLSKDTLLMKYEPGWGMGRDDMLWKSDLGRTEGR